MKPDEVRLVGQQAHDGLQKGYVFPDGWVLVPIEPTFEMIKASWKPSGYPDITDRYKAMLSAAPKPEVLQPTVPQPKPNLPKQGFGSVYDQQDRIDLEERDK